MPDFEREGIRTSDPLARKLWSASVIQGHRNPFGKPLTEYTIPELDFILEMAAIDDPDRWSFKRNSIDGVSKSESLLTWRSMLSGKALVELMRLSGRTRAMAGIEAWNKRRSSGLRPGLSRSGKRIDENAPTVSRDDVPKPIHRT